MLIEFVGESGCGKSTIARNIARNHLDYQIKPTISNGEALVSIVKHSLDSDYRWFFKTLCCLSRQAFPKKRHIKNVMYIARLLEIYFTTYPGTIMLLDQGIVQFLHTVYFFNEPDKEKCKEIVERLVNRFDTKLVSCHCSDEVLLERIEKRACDTNERKRRIEDGKYQTTLVDHHKKVFQYLTELFPEKNRFFIDTGEDLNDNASKIIQWSRNWNA